MHRVKPNNPHNSLPRNRNASPFHQTSGNKKNRATRQFPVLAVSQSRVSAPHAARFFSAGAARGRIFIARAARASKLRAEFSGQKDDETADGKKDDGRSIYSRCSFLLRPRWTWSRAVHLRPLADARADVQTIGTRVHVCAVAALSGTLFRFSIGLVLAGDEVARKWIVRRTIGRNEW